MAKLQYWQHYSQGLMFVFTHYLLVLIHSEMQGMKMAMSSMQMPMMQMGMGAGGAPGEPPPAPSASSTSRPPPLTSHMLNKVYSWFDLNKTHQLHGLKRGSIVYYEYQNSRIWGITQETQTKTNLEEGFFNISPTGNRTWVLLQCWQCKPLCHGGRHYW